VNHIERRANLWYATLTIPEDARAVIGKRRFVQSLGTPDKGEACVRSYPVIALWKAQIREARGDKSAVITEALRWKNMISTSHGTVEGDVLEDMLLEKVEVLQKELGTEQSSEFYKVAMGQATPSNIQFEQWKVQLEVAEKTKDQYIRDVTQLIKQFPSLEKISKQSVSKWAQDMIAAGSTKISVSRVLSSCRSYWSYLQSQFIVPVDIQPLANHLQSTKTNKSKAKNGWIPFEPSEVITLWQAAKDDDQELADLIEVGAYTGARIEEICSIKLENITSEAFKIVDAKTAAGIREVPIHSKLKATIKRLKDSSTDGYLFSGLSVNKYGDRSNAIGKRFGRLKRHLKFHDKKVFHSIRKTFVTQLENADVSEGIVADIVGHEKQTMTYGLYSGGARLDVKQKAIEHVDYELSI